MRIGLDFNCRVLRILCIDGVAAAPFAHQAAIDRPNSRSSHSTPTPRGGGLSMVAVTTCGAAILYAAGMISRLLGGRLILGGLSVAAVGFWDDVRSAPVAVRMTVHFGAAILAVAVVGTCRESASATRRPLGRGRGRARHSGRRLDFESIQFHGRHRRNRGLRRAYALFGAQAWACSRRMFAGRGRSRTPGRRRLLWIPQMELAACRDFHG